MKQSNADNPLRWHTWVREGEHLKPGSQAWSVRAPADLLFLKKRMVMEKKQHLMQDKSMTASCCFFPLPTRSFQWMVCTGNELQPSDWLRPGAALFVTECTTVAEGRDHHRKWQLEEGGGIWWPLSTDPFRWRGTGMWPWPCRLALT